RELASPIEKAGNTIWNDIVNANCARANTTASQPSNIGTTRRTFRQAIFSKTERQFSKNCARTRRLSYHARCDDYTCVPRGTGVRSYPAPDRLSLSRLVISACTARVWSLPTSTGL